jgi:hypothetical protein
MALDLAMRSPNAIGLVLTTGALTLAALPVGFFASAARSSPAHVIVNAPQVAWSDAVSVRDAQRMDNLAYALPQGARATLIRCACQFAGVPAMAVAVDQRLGAASISDAHLP